MKKRDAAILIVMCGLALMCAGALRRGGSMRAKTLMCTVNMQKVGQGMSLYFGTCDGRMPTTWMAGTGVGSAPANCVRYHYMFSWYDGVSQSQIWLQFGCLYKAGIVPDAETFYCPATEGSIDDYKSYGGSAPWGTLPMPGNPIPPNQSQSVRLITGYAYWPQATAMVTGTTTLYGVGGAALTSNGYGNYRAGLPAMPLKASDIDAGKAMAVDNGSQPDGLGGYKVNALFPDGHTNYQPVPRYDGRWICPFRCKRPADAVEAQWYGDGSLLDNVAMMSNYMYLLEP
jgi:hypothetical protein